MVIDGGQLAEYIKVKALKPFLPNDLAPAENDIIPALIQFDTGGGGLNRDTGFSDTMFLAGAGFFLV